MNLDDLINFSISASPGGIEQSEAEGQKSFVGSDTLPKKPWEAWETLRSWGIVKGDDADDLFCLARLPEGWSKRRTDHSMWSDLIDDRGLKRAGIFYKAAFYDRDAFLSIQRRFCVVRDYDIKDRFVYLIKDRGLDRVIRRFEHSSGDRDKSEALAEAFLATLPTDIKNDRQWDAEFDFPAV